MRIVTCHNKEDDAATAVVKIGRKWPACIPRIGVDNATVGSGTDRVGGGSHDADSRTNSPTSHWTRLSLAHSSTVLAKFDTPRSARNNQLCF